jgi:hypothetical protein
MFKDAFPQSGFLSEIQLVLDSEWEKDARYAADADARVVVVQKMFKELRSMLDHSVAVQSKDWLVGDTEAHEKRCVKVGDLFFSAMLSAGSTWKDYTQNKIPFQRQERSWIKSVLDSNRTGLSWGEDPETGKTPNLSEAAFITSLQNAGEYDALTAKKVVAGIDAAYTEWLKNAEQKYSLEKSKALQERVQ